MNHINNISTNKRLLRISSSTFPVMLTLIIIIATLSSFNNHYFNLHVADAMKLTSLGSSIDIDKSKCTDDAIAQQTDDVEFLDYSSMACSASDDDGPSSSSLATCTSTYGVDNSFPIHHSFDAVDHDVINNPLGGAEKKNYYNQFLHGCREKYYPDDWKCDGSEEDRIEMNLRQPSSMFNYTTLGFHKTRAPASIISLLHKFWKNKFTSVANTPNETWGPGNTYTNHWASPTKMINVDRSIRKPIWDASKEVLEQWVGTELSPTSLYGVRVYGEGSILAPHVDRTPLVISAIINVAQDVDEPWPLEVYGHDGNAYNITIEPGEMIFYESHSVIHGRPFPLKGRYYANVFVHFEPLGHTLQYEEEHNTEDEESLASLYQSSWKKLQSKCSDDEECKARVDLNVDQKDKVPHYIIPGSEEERRWLQTHPKARVDTSKDDGWVKGLNVHTAASSGDLDALIAIAAKNPELLKKKDSNGWNAIHESVRGGHVDVVKWLLDKGLDKNERTHTGDGGSPLWWAKKTFGVTHPMVQFLESIDAKEIPPEGYEAI